MKRLFVWSILIISIFALTACSNNEVKKEDKTDTNSEQKTDKSKDTKEDNEHEGMHHSSSGEIPDGLKVAKNPSFPVGSTVIIQDGHMEGMKDAEAKIAGAFNTIAYIVSYTPTDGGEKVTNHKWVIQEEIEDHGNKELKEGSEVKLEADHMKGMEGAIATIDSAQKTTVYMIDFTPTTGGQEIKNHKWVTEDELLKEQ